LQPVNDAAGLTFVAMHDQPQPCSSPCIFYM
jgi:hypothetical protein